MPEKIKNLTGTVEVDGKEIKVALHAVVITISPTLLNRICDLSERAIRGDTISLRANQKPIPVYIHSDSEVMVGEEQPALEKIKAVSNQKADAEVIKKKEPAIEQVKAISSQTASAEVLRKK